MLLHIHDSRRHVIIDSLWQLRRVQHPENAFAPSKVAPRGNFGFRPFQGDAEETSTRLRQGNHGYMEIELRALLRNELPGTVVSFDKLLATVLIPLVRPTELLPCLILDIHPKLITQRYRLLTRTTFQDEPRIPGEGIFVHGSDSSLTNRATDSFFKYKSASP